MDTLKSLYHSHALPKRVLFGTSLMSADRLLKHLKRLLPQHWSSPIGFQTPRSQSKPMPLTTHLQQYCQSQPRTANCTPFHSTPKSFQIQDSTTMCTTKSYSQFLKPSNVGDIILKALHSRSMWSPITRIYNTFQQPKSSHVSKHDGPNTFPPSTSSSVFILENSAPNPMHSLDGMSILKR